MKRPFSFVYVLFLTLICSTAIHSDVCAQKTGMVYCSVSSMVEGEFQLLDVTRSNKEILSGEYKNGMLHFKTTLEEDAFFQLFLLHINDEFKKRSVSIPLLLEPDTLVCYIDLDKVELYSAGTEHQIEYSDLSGKLNKFVMKRTPDSISHYNNIITSYIRKYQDQPMEKVALGIAANFLMLTGKVEMDLSFYESFCKNHDSTFWNQLLCQLVENRSEKIIGRDAPEFVLKSFSGKQFRLSDHLSKVTIIDFWATWCGPCIKEFPALIGLYNDFHSKGLEIIGVSTDKVEKSWNKYLMRKQLPWINLIDNVDALEQVASRYKVASVPSNFILNSSGIVVAKDVHGEELRLLVESLLAD